MADIESLGLFMAHRDKLVSYASSIVGDAARAEDVVQEAWLRFHAVGNVHLAEPVGYLYRIVRNLALDGRRRQVRETRTFVQGAATAVEAIAEQQPSPEAQAAARSEMQALQAAMAELPERTRTALEMHSFGDCTLKEIAAFLGISVGLAHSLVIDGLEHCRSRLRRPRS